MSGNAGGVAGPGAPAAPTVALTLAAGAVGNSWSSTHHVTVPGGRTATWVSDGSSPEASLPPPPPPPPPLRKAKPAAKPVKALVLAPLAAAAFTPLAELTEESIPPAAPPPPAGVLAAFAGSTLRLGPGRRHRRARRARRTSRTHAP